MANQHSYQQRRSGEWRLWVLPERWREELWESVRGNIENEACTKHPKTIELRCPSETEDLFYLKIFYSSGAIAAVRDVFRWSKAVRAFRLGLELSAHGFSVPLTLAAGELRKNGVLERAFLLTARVKGKPMPQFLGEFCSSWVADQSLAKKRQGLKKLAVEIKRLHDAGFVHGDLVPTNVFVFEAPGQNIEFYLMDNDRTRKYPKWLPQRLWKRNLVQLNRIPLAGITLQDRLRFLRYYLWRAKWSKADRKFLLWLEMQTRKRRKECDGVEGAVSFRKLMRPESSV